MIRLLPAFVLFWVACAAVAVRAQESDPARGPAVAAPRLEDRVGRLIQDLGSNAWETREAATQALAELVRAGEPVVPTLLKALDHPEPEIRHRVRLILEQTGKLGRTSDLSGAKAEALLDKLGRRPIVYWAFPRQDEPALNEWDLDGELAGAKGDATGSVLVAALSSDNVVLRRNVAWLLGRLEALRSVPALEQALDDADPEVRTYALFSLGSLRDVSALPAILEMPAGQPATVRAARMIALEKLPDPTAVAACLEGLRDESAEVRFHAFYTLRRWTAQELGYNAWYPAPRRAAAAAAWDDWWEAHREGFQFPSPEDH